MEIVIKGLLVQVDDDDASVLDVGSWWILKSGTRRNYVVRSFGSNKKVYLHRVILGLTDEPILVDHINGNGLDNRRENIRLCTNAENMRNQRKSIISKSPYKGITWLPKNKKWMAQITDNTGKHKYLGSFVTPEEAHAAYCEAADMYHGSFARTE